MAVLYYIALLLIGFSAGLIVATNRMKRKFIAEMEKMIKEMEKGGAE